MDVNKYQKIVDTLKTQLTDLFKEDNRTVTEVEHAIGLCRIALQDLKNLVSSDGFGDIQEEINYFKHIKPEVSGELIFNIEYLMLISFLPKFSVQAQLGFFQREIQRINKFFEAHKGFVLYYRTNQTYLDDKYFVRNSPSLVLNCPSYNYILDPDFSTVYDAIVSRIIAYDRLEEFLSKEIAKLSGDKIIGEGTIDNRSKWTESDVAFAELIYALVETCAIDNGKITIKKLVELFGEILEIPKGNIYSAFRDIHSRKKDKVVFLDELQKALIRKIDEANK